MNTTDPDDLPGASRRARRKQARPAEIVAAALSEFSERGFAATRLDDVAARAGIAKGTVYLYFDGKEALFEAVVRQELLPLLERGEQLVDAYPGSASELLREIATRMEQAMESEVGGIPRLVLAESGNFPRIAKFYAEEVVARGVRLFSRVLERGVVEGEFRPVPARPLIPAFFGPVLIMLLWRHSAGRHTDFAFDPRTVLQVHLDTFLRGIAADPDPATAGHRGDLP
jgi:AcrR family transcriptional regulator